MADRLALEVQTGLEASFVHSVTRQRENRHGCDRFRVVERQQKISSLDFRVTKRELTIPETEGDSHQLFLPCFS